MGQQVGRVGEPGAGLQPPPQHQQQPRGLRGSSAARPAGRRREAVGRTAEGGFNIFTQHGEGPGRAGGANRGWGPPALAPHQRIGWGARNEIALPSPPSFVVVGLNGGGESCCRGEERRLLQADRAGQPLPRPGGCSPRPGPEPGDEIGAGETSPGAGGKGLPAMHSRTEVAPPGIKTCSAW